MIVIKRVRQTCSASPSQWEGETVDGKAIYIRYRWGALSIGIGEDMDQAVENQMNEDDAFFYAEPSYELVPSDSVITFNQLKQLTGHIIQWVQ